MNRSVAAITRSRGAVLSSGALWALSWLAVACGGAPLLIGRPAALEDWPSHVARVDILLAMLRGDAHWAQFYTVNTLFLPNIAADACIAALNWVGLSVGAAASATLLLTYLLFVLGAHFVSFAVRAADPIKPLFAAILFFNGALLCGFVNFTLGTAVALCVLAVWLATQRPILRAAVAVIAIGLVFFCHVIAAGLLLGVMGLVELSALVRSRRFSLGTLLRHSSPALAGLVLAALFLLSPTSSSTGGGHKVGWFGDGMGDLLRYKASLLVHPFVDGSGVRGGAILVIGAVLVLGSLCAAMRARTLRLRPLPQFAFVAVGLALLILVLPRSVGAGEELDSRLPPVAVLLCLLLIGFEWRSARVRTWCFVLLWALTMGRAASFGVTFEANASVYRDFAAKADGLPSDSVLLSGMGTSWKNITWSEFWAPPTEYMGTEAVASGVFVPSVFAFASQHTIVLRDAFRGWQRQFAVSDPEALRSSQGEFDRICARWSALGHSGPVLLLISYPSAFSDSAYPASARLIDGPRYRVVKACRTAE